MTPRRQLSIRMDHDDVNRVRATVRGLRRLGNDATLTGIFEHLVQHWCTDQERTANHGDPFPAGAIRRGRAGRPGRNQATEPIAALIHADVKDRFQFTVAGLQEQGEDISIVGVMEELLDTWCTDQERLHNRGRPFPTSHDPLPAGRRL